MILETRKAIQKKSWNILTQTACVVDINVAASAKLAVGVLNVLKNSVDDVQSVAQCQKPNFPKILAGLLKILYDRIGLVAATITTLNVLNSKSFSLCPIKSFSRIFSYSSLRRSTRMCHYTYN